MTSLNRLKQTPGSATPTTIRLWIERLDWLAGLIDPDLLLEGVAHTKLRQFAAEAAAWEVSGLLDIAQPGKRHPLLLALLRQACMRCRDELAEMMLRRVRCTQAAVKECVGHACRRGEVHSLLARSQRRLRVPFLVVSSERLDSGLYTLARHGLDATIIDYVGLAERSVFVLQTAKAQEADDAFWRQVRKLNPATVLRR